MLVVGDARMGVSQELGQRALALFDRRAPQVLAVHFEQIEGAEHGGGIVPVCTDTAMPLSSHTTASPSIRQERTGSRITAATICGKRFEKLVPSASQIALFVGPALVLLSYIVGPTPMDLQFWPGAIVMVFVATLVAAFITSGGRSAWFVGVLLVFVYAVFAITLYLLPPQVQ
jgi:hypothetical protein